MTVASDPPIDTQSAVEFARRIRLDVLEMTSRSGASHIGTSFSIADIIAVLYGGVLAVDPAQPEDPTRDRFILSKGHGCAALYAALADRGFFPREWLDTFCQDDGHLFGHITHHGVPGVEASTGALGHGLPIASGMALWAQRRDEEYRVVALLSDGECDEGSTWEAALFAGHQRLSRLTAIVDYNSMQSLATTQQTLDLDPLADKWTAFGWAVREVDGHDHAALAEALGAAPDPEGRPSCVIARDIKGKGVSFMENEVLWHYRAAVGDEYERAREELEA